MVRVSSIQKKGGQEGKEEGKVNPMIKGGVMSENKKYMSVLFKLNDFIPTVTALFILVHTTGLGAVSHWLMDGL